jgi:hypothetical protein
MPPKLARKRISISGASGVPSWRIASRTCDFACAPHAPALCVGPRVRVPSAKKAGSRV